MLYHASCHCQTVKIEMEGNAPLTAVQCNCSMCGKSGFLHVLIPASRFRLVQGKEHLSCYSFNSHVAKHYFCKTCGLRPFYIPRSNPDGYSVNARCLDPFPTDLVIEPFDGRNWEQHAHTLAHLSKDENADD